jgi:hypothetical protein
MKKGEPQLRFAFLLRAEQADRINEKPEPPVAQTLSLPYSVL